MSSEKFFSAIRITKVALLASFLLASSICSAWTIHKNFESGEIGTSAQGQEDGFTGDSGGSEYVNEKSSLGDQSVKLNVRGGTAGFGYWGGTIQFPSDLSKNDEIWISLRLFIPQDFEFSTDTGYLKFLRVRQKNEDGSHTGYLDNLITVPNPNRGTFTLLKEGQNLLRGYGEPGIDDIPRERWFRFELYAYLDDVSHAQGGQAVVRAWLDDKLIAEEYDLYTLSNATAIAKSLYLFTYWNGGAPKDQHLFVDDIIITSERPSGRDTYSNPMIGAWPFSSASPPNPPSLTID
jgi:hypothetical protein